MAPVESELGMKRRLEKLWSRLLRSGHGDGLDVPLPSGWRRYTTPGGGLAFAYPATWTIREQRTDGPVSVLFAAGGARWTFIAIGAHAPAPLAPPDPVLQELIAPHVGDLRPYTLNVDSATLRAHAHLDSPYRSSQADLLCNWSCGAGTEVPSRVLQVRLDVPDTQLSALATLWCYAATEFPAPALAQFHQAVGTLRISGGATPNARQVAPAH